MNAQPIQVLLIEGEPVYADLLQEILRAELIFQVARAGRFDEGLQRLSASPCDVVVLDLSLPDRRGLATVHELRVKFPSVAIVVLTGVDDGTHALEAVREG